MLSISSLAMSATASQRQSASSQRSGARSDACGTRRAGVITVGKSVAAAWDDLYYLERACEVRPPPGHTRRSPPATRTHLKSLDRIRMCAHRWEPCVHVERVVASTIARSACPVRCKPVFKTSFFTFQTRPPASSGWAVWSGCCPRIARCPLPPGDECQSPELACAYNPNTRQRRRALVPQSPGRIRPDPQRGGTHGAHPWLSPANASSSGEVLTRSTRGYERMRRCTCWHAPRAGR